jgi:hypothetical protein
MPQVLMDVKGSIQKTFFPIPTSTHYTFEECSVKVHPKTPDGMICPKDADLEEGLAVKSASLDTTALPVRFYVYQGLPKLIFLGINLDI